MHNPFMKFVFPVLLLMAILFITVSAQAQDYNPNPKTMDGKLDDWGNGTPFGDPFLPPTHLYDNEAQVMENADNIYDLDHPGMPNDEPLKPSMVREPPMGNGFNMVSVLAAFDPDYAGGTYYLAMDLPGETNPNLSDSFPNTFVENYYAITWYPLPFDVDCNQDRDTVDDMGSGYGSIINSSVNDHSHEFYHIYLWVGGDPEEASSGGSYTGPGFPIFINMEMSPPSPFLFEAIIPGPYTLSGSDLHLDASGLNVAAHSNPHLTTAPGYDIEVEVREIFTMILPQINLSNVGYPPSAPMGAHNCYHAYISYRADADGDYSNEEELSLGLHVPPMIFNADRNTISYSSGGDIYFNLNAGSANGLRNYLILGSLSGTSPGTALPGGLTTLPVNWDNFTDFIVARLNSTIFIDFFGTLNANGQGTARISAPPVSSNKYGKVMHYAYLLEGPPWDFVSQPVAIKFGL